MKNAFSAYVFGSYEKFIPFYIYSISKNYPESFIVLFYDGELSKDVYLFAHKFEKVTIYEKFNEDFGTQWLDQLKIRGGGKKTLLRFLIEGKFFSDFDHVYFGDIDILILDEGYSLFDFHIGQIQTCGIPFSNKVRKMQNGELSKRLTGLHFVQTKPYFQKMNPLILDFFSKDSFRNRMLQGIQRDEELLYAMNMECFKFNAESLSNNIRPWHGFHLGLVRGKKYLNKSTVAENSNLELKEIRYQLAEYTKDKEFIKIFSKVFCTELYFTYKFLEIKLSPYIHLKYIYTTIHKWLITKLRVICKSLKYA